jgi:HAD superfamily hydrolase (TIGR01549 family)
VTQPDRHTRADGGPDAAGERVVLFDMDGVLIEGRGTDGIVHELALDDALADRGLDPDPETRALLSGYEYDTDFALGCAQLSVDPVAFYDQREQYSVQHSIDRLDADSRTPYADVDALDDIASRYTVGLVSNNYDAVVEFVVDRHGFDAFDHHRGREPGVQGFYRRKPDPHYLLEAMEALDGSTGFYVGDRATDVRAAVRGGLDAVFIQRPHNNTDNLPVVPTIVADSLQDFASRLGTHHRSPQPSE